MRASLIIEALGGRRLGIGHQSYVLTRKPELTIPQTIDADECCYIRFGVWRVYCDRVDLMHPKMDYSNANGKGTRGVRACYVLEPRKIYWVRSPTSWRSVDEYACTVTEEGDIERVEIEDPARY